MNDVLFVRHARQGEGEGDGSSVAGAGRRRADGATVGGYYLAANEEPEPHTTRMVGHAAQAAEALEYPLTFAWLEADACIVNLHPSKVLLGQALYRGAYRAGAAGVFDGVVDQVAHHLRDPVAVS